MDNWKEREKGRVCGNCIYFIPKSDNPHPVKGYLGRCRRHAPMADFGWPVVWSTDWCGDFKLNEKEAIKDKP